MRLLLLGLFCLIYHLDGKPNGTPKEACFYMTPRHIHPHTYRKVFPTKAMGLYNITTSADVFRPDRPIRVTLWGPPFKGFMMVAAEEGAKDWPTGIFYSEDGSSKSLSCLGRGDSVTHQNNSYKDSVSVLWYGPENMMSEQIQFIATVVVNLTIYYTDIKSGFLRLDPSLAAPVGAEGGPGGPVTMDPWLAGNTATRSPWGQGGLGGALGGLGGVLGNALGGGSSLLSSLLGGGTSGSRGQSWGSGTSNGWGSGSNSWGSGSNNGWGSGSNNNNWGTSSNSGWGSGSSSGWGTTSSAGWGSSGQGSGSGSWWQERGTGSSGSSSSAGNNWGSGGWQQWGQPSGGSSWGNNNNEMSYNQSNSQQQGQGPAPPVYPTTAPATVVKANADVWSWNWNSNNNPSNPTPGKTNPPAAPTAPPTQPPTAAPAPRPTTPAAKWSDNLNPSLISTNMWAKLLDYVLGQSSTTPATTTA